MNILENALRTLCKEKNTPLGEVTKREDERRVELHSLPEECEVITPLFIRQGFVHERRVDNKPHTDVRVREENHRRHSMTAKHRPLKHECNMSISKEMFEALWPSAKCKQTKERYVLNNGWIIDKIKTDKRIVAEYEYGKKESNDSARIPKHWKVKKDLGRN